MLLKTQRIVTAFLALLFAAFSLLALAPVPAHAQSDSTVEAILGTSLNESDKDNFKTLVQGDFEFSIIDRHNIRVTPSNDNAALYSSPNGTITFGDIFPEQGVILSDDAGDDNLIFKDDEFGMRIDEFDNNGDLQGAMDDVEGRLGTVDLGDLKEVEFTWALRFNVRTRNSDQFFVSTDKGWDVKVADIADDFFGTGLFSATGVRVTSFADKDNFNISLLPVISGETAVLQSTAPGTSQITFQQCETPRDPITFSTQCFSNEAEKISFPSGVTLEDIRNETGSFNTTYGNNTTLVIYGGSNRNVDDSLFSGNTTGGIETGPSCETEGGEFSFIVCPLLRFFNGAFTTLDDWIVRSLDFEDGYLADPDGTNQGVKRAWQNIRNIAYIVLVPIMLVMVIGTAIGSNAVDAYTVRRALPRLLAAIIFMSLSFDIGRLLVQVSDEVGRGVAGLIAQPFGGLENLELTDIFDPGDTEDGLAIGGIAALIVAGQAGYITIGVLLSFLFVGVVTLLIIFVLLTVRELLIVFFIVISPLAILTWIFRGNDGSWKFWWGTFWKLLMIFPIVMALLVTGRAFASIVDIAGDNGGGDLFTTLVKVVAFVGPYFGILAAFKLLGGAFGNLTGIVNDRSRGIFDRNRQFRQNSRKKAIEKAHSGQRWSGGNDKNLRGKLNKNAMNIAHLKHANDAGILNARDSINRSKAVTKLEKLNKMEEDLGLVAAAGNDAVSGVAASVLNGDKVDLANQIGKNQLATHMEQWEADGGYDGIPESDTEARAAAKADEKERFLTANAATFESKADEIVNLRSSGKLQKALETAYDTDATDLVQHYGRDGTDQAIAQVMAGQRKYGDKSLSRFMVLKAMAGGTYYDGPQDTWRAAGLASKGDADAAATMVVKGRQALMGAGRAGEGAGGFGSTLGIMQNAAKIDGGNLQEATVELKKLGVKHINHVYEQNPAALLSQYNQKEGYIEDNLIPVMKERLREAAKKGTDSDEYIREVSIIENIHQSLKGTKPAIANMVGDQVMAYDPVNNVTLTNAQERAKTEEYNQQVKVFRESMENYAKEKEKAEIKGESYFGPAPVPPKRALTTARAETFRLQSDSRYQNYNRQWQDASAQQAQQEAAYIGTQQAIQATQNALNENPGQFNSGPPTFP